jgi:sodium/potassium/calcium exchanger 4
MPQVIRKHGGVIIHVLLATYMFTGLALVCDDYFVPALDRISEGKLHSRVRFLHAFAF